MKIYTKQGDFGTTSLIGKHGLSKASAQIRAIGALDELNSTLGVAVSSIKDRKLQELLLANQSVLFELGSELAQGNSSKKFKLKASKIVKLEKIIDLLDSKNTTLKSFILPGGSSSSALLHYARSVARRAESETVGLAELEAVNPNILKFLNRLSDFLFVLARYINMLDGNTDVLWVSKESKRTT